MTTRSTAVLIPIADEIRHRTGTVLQTLLGPGTPPVTVATMHVHVSDVTTDDPHTGRPQPDLHLMRCARGTLSGNWTCRQHQPSGRRVCLPGALDSAVGGRAGDLGQFGTARWVGAAHQGAVRALAQPHRLLTGHFTRPRLPPRASPQL